MRHQYFDQFIVSLLARGDLLTAQDLARSTGKSQASISQALTRLGEAVHKMGAARSTRYGLVKNILGDAGRQTLWWRGADGGVQRLGDAVFMHGDWLHVKLQPLPSDDPQAKPQEYLTQSSLPWFLKPLKPEGFLGRSLLLGRSDLPSNPEQCSLEQTLYAMKHLVRDGVGAVSLGFADQSLDVQGAAELPAAPKDELGSEVDHAVQVKNRLQAMAKAAQAAMQSHPRGSSAGGEQPKFIWHEMVNTDTAHAVGTPQNAIVKFSPPRGTPFGERWHSLLQLEALALQVLHRHGIAAAQTQVWCGERTYLQSQRFDCVHVQGSARSGRRHMVSATALNEAYAPHQRLNWVETAELLVRKKLLAPEHVRTVALSFLFGRLIGNTDMHSGNCSFFADSLIKPQFVPTPVYDMLPMMWRPDVHSGGLELRPLWQLAPALPGYAAEADLARVWALEFWRSAAALSDLSADVAAAVRQSLAALERGMV